MAFIFSRRHRSALSNLGQLIILGLLFTLLLPRQGTTAIKCLSNIDDKGQVGNMMSVKDCAKDGHHRCFTMDLVEPKNFPKVLFTLKGCQNASVPGLYCLRYFHQLRGEGNCLRLGQPKSQWDLRLSRCSGEGGVYGDILPVDHHVHLCTCNDGDECNRDCECNANYGLCGRDPCPTYKCHCEGTSSSPFPGNCSDGGGKDCPGEAKTGCYTVSQEGASKLYRDCAVPPGMVKCIHGTNSGKMVKASGPGDCATGTNGDWIDTASRYCHWNDPKKGPVNDDRGARMKACRCSGEYCNRETISWEDADQKNNRAAVGNQGTWIWTLILGVETCRLNLVL